MMPPVGLAVAPDGYARENPPTGRAAERTDNQGSPPNISNDDASLPPECFVSKEEAPCGSHEGLVATPEGCDAAPKRQDAKDD